MRRTPGGVKTGTVQGYSAEEYAQARLLNTKYRIKITELTRMAIEETLAALESNKERCELDLTKPGLRFRSRR